MKDSVPTRAGPCVLGCPLTRADFQREAAAGLATFMTMAYIIFVNPALLEGAGMPKAAVISATCIAAALPTLVLGLWTRYPFALAPGMGLNAALVIHASQPGCSWQTMMGVVIIEGLLVTLLVLAGVREQVMQAIPLNLKKAIGVGIGLFIAFLGFQQMGWVVSGGPGALLAPGGFTAKPTLVASAGLLVLLALLAYHVRGAILAGILATALLAWIADFAAPATTPLVRLPDQWVALPAFDTFARADLAGALKPALVGVIFAFLITDFFDTMGTVIGIGEHGRFLDAQGRLPRLNRVLLVDALAAVWGGCCGASSVTTYVESAAGVSQGGRTGLVSVVVALLFLGALFFAPAIGTVPAIATAPALVVVGFLMVGLVRDMDLASPHEGIPAFLTLILIPLTQSISCGIGVGFIAAVLLKVVAGRAREVSPWLYAIAALFALSFAWPHS
ncbi:MAG TPA: NCS2 family permease [Verrucomicrobiota bacterium]|nr:NCS2 family permease [Verrucomicrobiota bacterium]